MENNHSSMITILKYVRKHWITYTILFILVVTGILNGILSAWFLQNITDAAIRSDKILVIHYFIVGVIVIILMMLLQYLNTFLTSLATNKVKYSLKTDVYNHILKLPTQYMDSHHSGDLNSRINQDIDQVEGAIGNNLVQFIRLPLWAIASFIYLLNVNWQLACLTLILGPIALFISKVMGNKIRTNSLHLQTKISKSIAHISDTLMGHTTIRLFGLEQMFSKKYQSQNDDILSLQVKDGKLQGLIQALSTGIGFSAQIIVLGIGAFFVVDGKLTMGALMAFITLSQGLISPFSDLGYLWGGLQRSLAAVDRILQLLREPTVESKPDNINISSNLKSGIEFINVGFEYKSQSNVLKNVNIKIESGKKVAIVGPSGAGKTTLFNLLLGLYSPSEGKILIDSIEVNEANSKEVRKYISLVPQNTYLFDGTIRENIMAGCIVTEEEMERVAKLANIDGFVKHLSKGYDTEIGENGVLLSGGQKQKISIARALLRNTPILLLDEATSSLDSQSEAEIQNSLKQLMQGSTTIVIAHRMSTILDADLIIVMNQGNIECIGTHEELITKNDLYRELYALQFNLAANENTGLLI